MCSFCALKFQTIFGKINGIWQIANGAKLKCKCNQCLNYNTVFGARTFHQPGQISPKILLASFGHKIFEPFLT
jgi:ribosomal protein S27E